MYLPLTFFINQGAGLMIMFLLQGSVAQASNVTHRFRVIGLRMHLMNIVKVFSIKHAWKNWVCTTSISLGLIFSVQKFQIISYSTKDSYDSSKI